MPQGTLAPRGETRRTALRSSARRRREQAAPAPSPFSLPSADQAVYCYFFRAKPVPFTQAPISSSVGCSGNLFASRHVPLFPESLSRVFPLSPSELECEVQKGSTVFPVKSCFSTKFQRTLGAVPHQMGYPRIR